MVTAATISGLVTVKESRSGFSWSSVVEVDVQSSYTSISSGSALANYEARISSLSQELTGSEATSAGLIPK